MQRSNAQAHTFQLKAFVHVCATYKHLRLDKPLSHEFVHHTAFYAQKLASSSHLSHKNMRFSSFYAQCTSILPLGCISIFLNGAQMPESEFFVIKMHAKNAFYQKYPQMRVHTRVVCQIFSHFSNVCISCLLGMSNSFLGISHRFLGISHGF